MLRLVNLSICFLYVVFLNIRLERQVLYGRKKTPFRESSVSRGPVSLQSDVVSSLVIKEPNCFANQLQDLISDDEGMGVAEVNKLWEQKSETEDASERSSCEIDEMINANIVDFSNQPRHQIWIGGSTVCCPGLVHRRPVRVDL